MTFVWKFDELEQNLKLKYERPYETIDPIPVLKDLDSMI